MRRVFWVLVLAFVFLPACAGAEELPPPPTPSAEAVVGEVVDLPLLEAEGPTELEVLISINTYLTYIFAFGLVLIVLAFGKLLYRFFNMFF